jgi:signal transduction histidine kinase
MPRMGSPDGATTVGAAYAFNWSVTRVTSIAAKDTASDDHWNKPIGRISLTMTRAYIDDVSAERLASLQEQNLELSRLVAELRNEAALRTQFLSNISHDLRTPLTAVITHAEILRDGMLGPVNERQLESVRGIIAGGRQLLEQVGEILTYARGAAHQLMLTPSTFSIAEVVSQVTRLNESLLSKKRLGLDVHVDADLQPLFADREKVAHILGNLFGNAIDFTQPGGRVWINATARDSELLVEVGDTGIGIASEHHDFIFEEFAQVDASASRQHHGTGLGLTIAQKLVELHRGRIWVESELGGGSRFYFTILYPEDAK